MKVSYVNEFTLYSDDWKFSAISYDTNLIDISKGKIRFKFIGFVNFNGYLICSFPKDYPIENLSHKEKQNEAKLLLKVLNKYQKKSVITQEISKRSIKQKNENFLTLAQELIVDFHKYGIISIKEKKRSINGPGKTNWGRTIKKINPAPLGTDLIYLNLINERHFKSLNNDLLRIHVSILKEIEHNLGWLYNFKLSYSNIDINIQREKAISQIKKALRRTFNQNLNRRLNLLLAYLTYTYNSQDQLMLSNYNVAYTFYFRNVWEEITKVIFEDNKELHSMIPKYKWSLDKYDIGESNIIPDTLTYGNDREILIIDAKYYPEAQNDSPQGKLPGSTDISKQLIYRKSLYYLSNFEGFKFTNIFILPGVILGDVRVISNPIVVGFEDLNLVKDLGMIFAIYIDMRTAMLDYLVGESKYKNSLINRLEDFRNENH